MFGRGKNWRPLLTRDKCAVWPIAIAQYRRQRCRLAHIREPGQTALREASTERRSLRKLVFIESKSTGIRKRQELFIC